MNSWSETSRATDQAIISWAEQQPWALAMASCPQDPIWHAEGDVWTHTVMVFEQLTRLASWPELSRTSQLTLILTTLFHDSGKPAVTCTDQETGRIRSPKHAQVGARIARRCLMELGCDIETREHICNLVLFHGRPPFINSKSNPQRELIKHSWYVDHRLLYLFAQADSLGRICKDERNWHEPIECWRIYAEEIGCWSSPYAFANDHARFLFYRDRLENLHYTPYEDYRCIMTIMCGLPGAGKDSWLAVHEPTLPVVSLDDIRNELGISPEDNQGKVVQTAKQRCRERLREKTDFALNATNTTRQVRKLWIDLGAEYGA